MSEEREIRVFFLFSKLATILHWKRLKLFYTFPVFFIVSELQKWWARYLESINELEGAVNFYRVANDNLSVVRILCIQDKIDEVRLDLYLNKEHDF